MIKPEKIKLMIALSCLFSGAVSPLCFRASRKLRSETDVVISRSLRLPGTVIGFRKRAESGDPITFAPVVDFSAPDGALREITGQVSSNNPQLSIGQKIFVYYDVKNDTALIDDPTELYLLADTLRVLAIGFAALCGVCGAGFIVLAKWYRPKAGF